MKFAHIMKHLDAPNVFLVGFMASGKTSVGKALARELGWRFVDTDMEIERSAKKSISRIFSEKGEFVFRRIEEKTVSKAASGRNVVVALGGGAVLRPRNVSIIRNRGLVVYLHAPAAELLRRAEREGISRRPILAAFGKRARGLMLRRLLARRAPLYRAASHLALRTSSAFPDALAMRLLKRLRREGCFPA
jgi:shikimate kinase